MNGKGGYERSTQQKHDVFQICILLPDALLYVLVL